MGLDGSSETEVQTADILTQYFSGTSQSRPPISAVTLAMQSSPEMLRLCKPGQTLVPGGGAGLFSERFCVLLSDSQSGLRGFQFSSV